MGLLTFWYALSCDYEHEPTLTTYIHSQMERLHQMNVIPDVLPDFHPSFDMRSPRLASLKPSPERDIGGDSEVW